ncbi:hypothetical protein, partial [Salmonella sp. s54836]|uniref:hypothetical protein n=1 Tax=Salmonella sp. s54836 TaxID=3159673 RepID=UPI00397FCF83
MMMVLTLMMQMLFAISWDSIGLGIGIEYHAPIITFFWLSYLGCAGTENSITNCPSNARGV